MIELKKLDLKFLSEENGKPCHKHILNGREVPGCTSISGLFQDDGWKFAWPPKLMAENLTKALVDRIGQCTCHPQSNEICEFEFLDGISGAEMSAYIRRAKNAWREKRDKAADTGTIAHAWIAEYISGKTPEFPTNPEVLNAVNQFLHWNNLIKPRWLASELQVGSEIHNFAGILDAIAEINGQTILLDFKTSKDIKDDYAIQLAGLCICLEEMGLKVDARIILHLPKEGEYEYRIIDSDLDADKAAFLAGLVFYRHKNIFFGRNK